MSLDSTRVKDRSSARKSKSLPCITKYDIFKATVHLRLVSQGSHPNWQQQVSMGEISVWIMSVLIGSVSNENVGKSESYNPS